ncbi:hypothetical protein LTS08_008814 [Lithohypha guttulata]|nr:hypothetical protein LTS08_008814 [Lithohypha guttulata]
MAESQVVSVDEIAHDNEQLRAKARELTGEDVLLDEKEVVGKDLELVESSVCAVLVKRQSAWGAVRVTGSGTPKETPNVVTSPQQEPGYSIIVIKPGQSCRLFQNPTIRYFHRQTT